VRSIKQAILQRHGTSEDLYRVFVLPKIGEMIICKTERKSNENSLKNFIPVCFLIIFFKSLKIGEKVKKAFTKRSMRIA